MRDIPKPIRTFGELCAAAQGAYWLWGLTGITGAGVAGMVMGFLDAPAWAILLASMWGVLIAVVFLISWQNHKAHKNYARAIPASRPTPVIKQGPAIEERLPLMVSQPADTISLPEKRIIEVTEKREYVHDGITPTYLMGLYSQGNTHLQAGKVAAAYMNKWIIVSGNVHEVRSYEDERVLITFAWKSQPYISDPGDKYCYMHFSEAWHDRSAMLRSGDRVTVTGQITAIDVWGVTLQHCEFKE